MPGTIQCSFQLVQCDLCPQMIAVKPIQQLPVYHLPDHQESMIHGIPNCLGSESKDNSSRDREVDRQYLNVFQLLEDHAAKSRLVLEYPLHLYKSLPEF